MPELGNEDINAVGEADWLARLKETARELRNEKTGSSSTLNE